MSFLLLLQQSKRYSRHGLGFGGSLLKHSLVPLKNLCEVLPERGVVLDLGSGEGMLSNLIAHERPGLQVIGVDKDKEKITIANSNAPSNARFEVGDVFSFSFENAQGAVVNDVLHHHTPERQKEFLSKVASFLEDGAVFVLKEVDANDKFDKRWTHFWDSRLYPQDSLNFRTRKDWERMLADAGFRVLAVHTIKHPWPASRTVFVTRRERTVSINKYGHSDTAKVLVTGATGFLGQHVAAHLFHHGIGGQKAEVTALVRDASRVPAGIKGQCHLLISDVEHLHEHPDAVAQFDYVFHLAADKDFFGGKRVYENNIRGNQAIVDAFKGSKQLKRFVYASSMGAVDRAKNDSCDKLLDENSPAHPSSWYGKAKLEGERIVSESGLPFVVLRLPWCYGPGMSPITHVRVLTQMVMDGKFLARFDWPGRISIMAVSEVAKAFEFAAKNEQANGQVLYISDGRPIRFGSLFQEMGRLVGKPAGQAPIPSIVKWFIRFFHRFLPFTIKCLLMDALCVNDSKIRSLGFVDQKRGEYFLLPLVQFMNREKNPSLHRSKVIVTGAASGVGKILSAQLSASGRSVILIDKDARVAAEKENVQAESALQLDLANEQDIQKVEKVLEQNEVTCLVNCAGVGFKGKIGDSLSERHDLVNKVNVQALTSLTTAAVKNFSKSGDGVVVNIASSAGLQPLASMATYSASKAYVLNFSEAVGAELKGKRIAMITVCPAGVATNFQDNSGVRKVVGEQLLPPERVASEIVRAIEKKKTKTLFIGSRTHAMALIARVLPRKANANLWKGLMEKKR